MTGAARLDLAQHIRKPYATGPYKLTAEEANGLMDQVRASMPVEQFRKLTVLDLLEAYQDRKALFLIKAAVVEPLRFESKGLA